MASKYFTWASNLGIIADPFQAAIAAASTLPIFPGLNRYETIRARRLYAAANTRTGNPVAGTYRSVALQIREQIAARTKQPV